ncbi:hypothetical protein NAEGRDRAFT_82221 [Naegleria gruberi]|uniref:Uncharacterized protein n=1 Tax=Naegleria gruberi TaxID=5762 RepID=D2W3A8_NAEGR|nr:uncharacterized protein NAEGRDRAFT_82221 [Naegleria gruberi]EFC36484.1 hypothetical protein NAEGRDRAFT_82221 [Naegleria gruberi]|eukprot:XP_002669228.1 hypothetical protein NAEGRDRAFT_82221 [Naegleria gruberi strain NEG-M]
MQQQHKSILSLSILIFLCSFVSFTTAQRFVLQVNTTVDHPMFYTGYSSNNDQSFQSIGLRTFPLKESALSMFIQPNSFKSTKGIIIGATNFAEPYLYTFTNLAVTFTMNGNAFIGDGLIVCGSSGQSNDGKIGSGSEKIRVSLRGDIFSCEYSNCNWSVDGKWNKIGYSVCYVPNG